MAKQGNELDQYGVFGNPIQHSKSPDIHHAFAEQTGQALEYQKFLGDLTDFEQQVKQFFAAGGKGLNVTVPFKERAFALCDVLSKRAQQAGAVNTLMLGKNGDLFGDNTDGAGMVRDIRVNQGQALAGKRILLLGAGGAVRGVLEPLLDQKPQQIVIANRTLAKAQFLAQHFNSETCPCVASDFATLDGVFDVIINGTSASLSGQLPPLPSGIIGPQSWCYDMMYGAEPTVFLQWAAANGAQGADGLGMLVEQAAEAFFLWRLQRPETQALMTSMRQALQG